MKVRKNTEHSPAHAKEPLRERFAPYIAELADIAVSFVLATGLIANPYTNTTPPQKRPPTPPRSEQLNVYRVQSPDSPDAQVSDEYIRRVVDEASDVLTFDFQGKLEGLEINSITDLPLAPDDIRSETGFDCYSLKEVDALERNLSETTQGAISTLVFDDFGFCSDTAAAFAVGDRSMVFFRDDTESFLTPSTLLHEYGHTLGIGHEGAVECNISYYNIANNTNDLWSQSWVKTAEYGNGCSETINRDGSPNMYASNSTIMGNTSDYGVNSTSFSTIDRVVAFPDDFTIETVNPLVPQRYEISPTAKNRNGIAIMLPPKHPLRQLDSSLDRIVITPTTHLMTPKRDLPPGEWADCRNSLCEATITATNDDYSRRFDIPVLDYPSDDADGRPQPVYIDSSLGIGVEFVGYTKGDAIILQFAPARHSREQIAKQVEARRKILASIAAEEATHQPLG